MTIPTGSPGGLPECLTGIRYPAALASALQLSPLLLRPCCAAANTPLPPQRCRRRGPYPRPGYRRTPALCIKVPGLYAGPPGRSEAVAAANGRQTSAEPRQPNAVGLGRVHADAAGAAVGPVSGRPVLHRADKRQADTLLR